MSMTTFHEACKFCGSTRHELSSSGVDVCKKCDTGVGLIGARLAGISAADFRALVLEVAGVADLVPQHPTERFPAWRPRVILALDQRRKGQPIPEALLRPLSDGALKAFQAGQSASTVIFTASIPRMQPKAPEVKKPTEVRKSRIEQKTEPLKLWR
jgi:hypothetical protein